MTLHIVVFFATSQVDICCKNETFLIIKNCYHRQD